MTSFERESGVFCIDDTPVGLGYSGAPGHVGVVADEEIPQKGPIPGGVWTIGDPYEDPEKGPLTMRLTPAQGTATYGRSGFLLHGDNAARPPQSSSEGCIVAPHNVRQAIALHIATDRTLEVT